MKPLIKDPAFTHGKVEESKSDLGISRTIYAAGYSAKDALIAWAGVTVALAAALTYGIRKNFRAATWLMDRTNRYHDRIKETWLGKLMNGPVLVVSGTIGWMVSHLVMLPSGAVGWRKAQKAVDTYNALADQNTRLQADNASLTEENTRLKGGAVADEGKAPRTSFTEAQKPQNASFTERAALESSAMQSGIGGR